MTKKIAIDIDGVLADMHSPIFKRMGLPYTWEDVRRWDFFEELHVDRQKFWAIYKEIWGQQYQLIPLIEADAPATIAKLREAFEVHIVSSRPRETFSGTILWLKLRGIEYDRLLLLPPQIDKTEVIGNDILFLVDDNPAFVRDERVILFDRPWNQGVNAKRRIRSLKELLDILPAIESPPQRGV
jgi:5'(3')-deoxyribonucleotidase